MYFGPKTSESLWSIAESLEEQGLPHEVMDAEEGNKRVPILNLPLDYKCIMEENAGILKAPNALKAFQVMVQFCVCVCVCACVRACVRVCCTYMCIQVRMYSIYTCRVMHSIPVVPTGRVCEEWRYSLGEL